MPQEVKFMVEAEKLFSYPIVSYLCEGEGASKTVAFFTLNKYNKFLVNSWFSSFPVRSESKCLVSNLKDQCFTFVIVVKLQVMR